ncbi:hypothetical protein [Enterobacter phage vB_ExiM_F5M1E]|nr:hypothetical protein [Enterobacter phage vB_ExiM_F1M1E]UNA03235.1 hypothetical protein [Enterobacter phage vB_ExiM_F2M1E]UNA03555.1 hypothetical protein [Enterobacter phage vB_ExiM_F4M1E]UNA03876.1 hypothetical protein [Enterobacter phage vB_ExiM_F5M1E]UNA04196.1 hypothetical protein [Pantoea phage vB_PdiM_F5M2A]
MQGAIQGTAVTGQVMKKGGLVQVVPEVVVVIMSTTGPLMAAAAEERASTEKGLMELEVREDQPPLHLEEDQAVGSQQPPPDRSL